MPIMSKVPEGGAPGTAQFRSYTYWLTQVVLLALGVFTFYDLTHTRYLSIAFGIDNNILIAICMIAGFFVGASCSSIISVTYTQHTGTVYTEDRLGFAKSGGSDISFWSGFLSFIATLYVFTRFVPPGVLGVFRPFVVLIIAGVGAWAIARIVAKMVFSALYGPPEHKLF